FVAIPIAIAMTAVVAVISVAIHAVAFRLESPAVSGVIRAVPNTFPISTLEWRVVLRRCRCCKQCAGDRRKEPLSPAFSGMSFVNYYRPLRCRGREIAVGGWLWLVLPQRIRTTRLDPAKLMACSADAVAWLS